MDMNLPMSKQQAMFVAQKRRGTVKVCCIFCERRVGWFDIINIEIVMRRSGFVACEDCLANYNYWFNIKRNDDNDTNQVESRNSIKDMDGYYDSKSPID
jgi:hypothetical protein